MAFQNVDAAGRWRIRGRNWCDDIGQIFRIPNSRHGNRPWPIFHPRKKSSPSNRGPPFVEPPPPPEARSILFGQILLVSLAAFLCNVSAGRIWRAKEFADPSTLKCQGRKIFALPGASEPSLHKPIFKRTSDQFRLTTFATHQASRHCRDDLPRGTLQRMENVEMRNAPGLHFHNPTVHGLAPPNRPSPPQFVQGSFHAGRIWRVMPGQSCHGEPIAFRIAKGERCTGSAWRRLIAYDARRTWCGRINRLPKLCREVNTCAHLEGFNYSPIPKHVVEFWKRTEFAFG